MQRWRPSIHFTAWPGSLRLVFIIFVSSQFISGCGSDHGRQISYPKAEEVNFKEGKTYRELRRGSADRRWATQVSYNRNESINEIPHEWIPPQQLEDKGRWEGIIIHHSLTDQGSAAIFDKFHREQRRFANGLGYHFVINNGIGQGKANGVVEVGHRWRKQILGAHTKDDRSGRNYYNEHTIGICLVGNFDRDQPTEAQYASLARLVGFLQQLYNIPTQRIEGHSAHSVKSCPGRFFRLENCITD